jgi:hypothetical protein
MCSLRANSAIQLQGPGGLPLNRHALVDTRTALFTTRFDRLSYLERSRRNSLYMSFQDARKRPLINVKLISGRQSNGKNITLLD